MSTKINVLSALLLGCAAPAAFAQTNHYHVEFDLSMPIDHVFVSAHEWNGSVYAWDLFPQTLGSIPAGRTAFDLGSHNVVSWAIFAVSGSTGMVTSINTSIDPPDGAAFASVFPNYSQATVRSQAVRLWNGAYDTQAGFAMFDFVLTNEDAIKTDRAAEALMMYSFSPGTNIGSARIALGPPPILCVADVDDGTFTGTKDGGVTIDDLLYYLHIFELGAIAADVDDGTFTGSPDGGVTIDDLLYFLFRFESGC